MCEELSYQIINTSAVNQPVIISVSIITVVIVIIRSLQKPLIKKRATQRCTFLNSFKRDLAKHIRVKLGNSEFLNIHSFNWYKALYLASSSTFRHLDFIRAIR